MRVRDLMVTIEEPAALQLWTMLVRHAPEDDVPNPAMLLAVAEHLHGNEPIATVALQRALAADPDHRHAQLLRQVFQLPPEALHDAVHDLAHDLTHQLD